MNKEGLFLALEGIANVGKTTQIELISFKLRELGHEVITVRSPGELVRPIILSQRFDPIVDWLLLAANRRHTYITEIKPALERGAIVIADRWIHSALAYQGLTGVRESDILWLETEYNEWADYVIFLDAPIEKLRERWIVKHIYNELSNEDYNYLRESFKRNIESHELIYVDALQEREVITGQIVKSILERL